MPSADAAKRADVVMMLAPDEVQAAIYRADVAPNLKKNGYLAFGHGFNIHFGQIVAPSNINVFMVAPKGPGHLVSPSIRKQRRALPPGRSSVLPGIPNKRSAWRTPPRSAGGARESSKTNSAKRLNGFVGEQVVLCGGLTP